MSLNDKILEIYTKGGHLSTEDVTRILKDKYQIDRSPRSIQRHVIELIEEGELTPDKPKGREQTYSTAKPGISEPISLWDRIKQKFELLGGAAKPAISEPISLWDRIKQKFEQVGGHLVDVRIKRTSDAGRDPVTGHYQFNHLTEETIKGIIILRSSVELVTLAQSFKIYLRDKYEGREFAGVVLTQDSISFMDHLSWKNELYKIWDTEDRDDGYNFSFRIGYLEWLPK